MYLNGLMRCLLAFVCFLSLSATAKEGGNRAGKSTANREATGGGTTTVNIPTPIITASGHCFGDTIYLYANPDTTAPGITYSWTGPSGFTSTLQNPFIPNADITNRGYYYVTDMIGISVSQKDSIYVDMQDTNHVAINITVSPNDTVCLGTNVTFTATTLTGGSSPTYQWMNSGTPVVGAVHSTWSTNTLFDGDVIYCILYSSLNCPAPRPANSNSITMSLPNYTPVIYLGATPGTTVAYGGSVTFYSAVVNAGPGALYEWTLNGTVVPGADSSTYTLPSVTGYDTVTLTVLSVMECASPAFATRTLVVHPPDPAGISTPASFANLQLFPNPNNGIMTLKGDITNAGDITVEIMNVMGQVVYTEHIQQNGTELNRNIDLGNIPAGVYLAHVTQNSESKILRFSVQR